MKNSLQLKLSQHLALTPQLQQSIKLLQLSTLELNQELERFLMENPLLERAEGWNEDTPAAVPGGNLQRDGESAPASAEGASSASTDGDNASGDTAPGEGWDFDDAWSGDNSGSNWKEGDEDTEFPLQAAAAPSLLDHLLSQLRLLNLTDRDLALCSWLIAHLDEEGYLGSSLEDILAQREEDELLATAVLHGAAGPQTEAGDQPKRLEYLAADAEAGGVAAGGVAAGNAETWDADLTDSGMGDVDLDDLQVALTLIQSLDPAGVGARSLGECLAIQLQALDASAPGRSCAIEIARKHLPLLANRDYLRLRRQLGCDEDELRLAQKLVAQCNPRPAAHFNVSEARFVIPDVMVRKLRNRWVVTLNPDAMPKLRINRLYADILNRNREHGGQMSAQLQEARWLIKNVQQRFETILKVSQAIVERQRHFFEHGEVAMRPLVLREIADTVGLHESTVSRVTTQKFMLTPRGIFELKYFFSSHVGTDTGGAASSTAIRALIKQLVSAEDCRKPLSDSRISDILAQQGIVVARRTVAKYREAMQIHPASQRKSL